MEGVGEVMGPGIKNSLETPEDWKGGRRGGSWETPVCAPPGKSHVCRFIGCGRNEKFNYVVMQLQVSPLGVLPLLPQKLGM